MKYFINASTHAHRVYNEALNDLQNKRIEFALAQFKRILTTDLAHHAKLGIAFCYVANNQANLALNMLYHVQKNHWHQLSQDERDDLILCFAKATKKIKNFDLALTYLKCIIKHTTESYLEKIDIYYEKNLETFKKIIRPPHSVDDSVAENFYKHNCTQALKEVESHLQGIDVYHPYGHELKNKYLLASKKTLKQATTSTLNPWANVFTPQPKPLPIQNQSTRKPRTTLFATTEEDGQSKYQTMRKMPAPLSPGTPTNSTNLKYLSRRR